MAGVKSGVGVTRMVLTLVGYIERHRGKVCAVELGDKTAFQCLYEAVYGESFEYNETFFKVRKTTYYPNYPHQTFVDLKQMNFELIIIDFGELTDGNVNLFNEQDIQVLVACGDEWNYKETLVVFERFNDKLTTHWKLVVPNVLTEVKHIIEKETSKKVYDIVEKQPFLLKKETMLQIETMLGIV